MTKNNLNVFQIVGKALNSSGIPFVLIGGFALNYYKVSRQTTDLDMFILACDSDKLESLFAPYDYAISAKNELFVRFRNPDLALLDLDFLLVDEKTFKKIIEKGEAVNISGEKFVIPSLEHLIAMKLHALKQNITARQTRDIPDIVALAEANKLNLQTSHFRELCLKYGNESILKKILMFAGGEK